MRPRKFVACGRGKIDVDDVAPRRVIGLLTHQISLPTGGPQSISPSTSSGVTPSSSSVSDYFFRMGVIVIAPDFTSTRTRSPARNFSCCAASRGIRRPRLLPHCETVLFRPVKGPLPGTACFLDGFLAVGISSVYQKNILRSIPLLLWGIRKQRPRFQVAAVLVFQTPQLTDRWKSDHCDCSSCLSCSSRCRSGRRPCSSRPG